ncbi:ATP-binding cassette domain-containing protein [Ruminococcus sp.]|uniref:ATP-binding cassette domain-containing protein n=1 Tax=Ruminococcus sp. TaxID=41978 RepID=UPI0025F0765F|nr:ATP-binding cassette domain-containing protein [Ruminococcus sp.]
MITAKNIMKIYGAGETACTALNDVSLIIGDNDIIAITGQSGSGKSTLINVLSTLDTPTEGTVKYNKKDITKLSEAKRAEFRLKNYCVNAVCGDYADKCRCRFCLRGCVLGIHQEVLENCF